MKNTKNIFMAMSLSAMLTFSGLMSGSVCAGGAKEYAAQAQLEALHARVAQVEANVAEEADRQAKESEKKHGNDGHIRENYTRMGKDHAKKINECLRIYEEGIETEDVIVRPTIAEDMPELEACLKKPCEVVNFGGYPASEGPRPEIGLDYKQIEDIFQKEHKFDGFTGFKGSITFKFTVVLKATEQIIGQYIVSYSANWPVQCAQHFCSKEHAGEFYKSIEVLQKLY
ncbi:MAG: hypothetical protein IJC97_00435 [Oscillospiraceae bacterium]|nr:hypothetical protein [Oscillospiraceae bacterium]